MFTREPATCFDNQWSRLHCPQVIFMQKLSEPLQVMICDVVFPNAVAPTVSVQFDVFHKNAKLAIR